MANKRFLDLLVRLSEATERGQVRWDATADEDMFRTALGRGMVRIGKSLIHDEDGHQDAVHTAYLLNEAGAIVDELEASMGSPNYLVLANLFTLARRKALGMDDLLQSMFEQLKQ